MNTRKVVGLIGFLFLLLALPVALFVVRQQVSYRGRAVNPIQIPKNIRITNLHDKGFTVSWTTDNNTTGVVLFGTTTTPTIVVNDIRGATTALKTHYVDVFDGIVAGVTINPATPYYFNIQSGDGTGNIFGRGVCPLETDECDQALVSATNPFKKTSAPTITYDASAAVPDSTTNTPGAYSLETGNFAKCNQNDATKSACFRPNPVWGKVVDNSGNAISGAVVYMMLPNTNHKLSTLTQSDASFAGKWVMDVANFRITSLSSYASYLPFNEGGAGVSFTVQTGTPGTISPTAAGIPEVIHADCANLGDPALCNSAPLLPGTANNWDTTDTANPYIKLVFTPAGITTTPTPTPTTPPITGTITPTPSGVPTATPTIRPTVTPTVVPSITPTPSGQPTGTPTPTIPPGTTTLTFKINFQNIANPAGTIQLGELVIKRGGTEYANHSNLTVTAGTGYFQGQVSLPNITTSASDYLVCIKGARELRKKFTNVTINVSQDNPLDTSSDANRLITGDLTGDNKITIADIGALRSVWTDTRVTVDDSNRRYDLNNNGFIDVGDLGWIRTNFTDTQILGDECN